MYQQYFNFREPPFSIAPDPQFLYMSERHQEGLAHLLYGINRGGGFVALTGEVGTGKTTLCHCLLQQLPQNVDVALILNPKLNAIELLATICDELGIKYATMTAKSLIDAINQYLLAAYADGRRTVLLIDEAQNLSLEVLEQIRLLTNLETSKAKLLQIVLVGQPELNKMLARQDLRQLNQRITARYHLLPLSRDETRAYIQHRLRVCNGNYRLFSAAAMRAIFRFTAGVPRLINILCDRALLGAYATNTRRITPAIVGRAAQEALGFRRFASQRYALLTLLIALGVGASVYWWRVRLPQTLPLAKAPPLTQHSQAEPTALITNNPTFADQMATSSLTLDAALAQAWRMWRQGPATNKSLTCDDLASWGLSCFWGKGNWQELLSLDRPAVLVFAGPGEHKRYALLVGVDKDQAIVHLESEVRVPLAEILTAWDGSYLLLWRPPRPGLIEIAPQQQSVDVQWLREQLRKAMGAWDGGGDSQVFDEGLKAQLMAFQRRQHLVVDGIAGARTLIHLDNQTGAGDSPHLEITHR